MPGSITVYVLPIVIWMLRHAEAEDGSPDAERALTAKGEEQAQAAGRRPGGLGVELDACVTSPRCARARPRAGLRAAGRRASRRTGGWRAARSTRARWPTALGEHVLLVGHDPDFSLACTA